MAGRERAAEIRAAIEDLAQMDGSSPPLIGHVCRTCLRLVGAAGVCTAVPGQAGLYEPLCAVGPIGVALAELQVTVGEGPGMETVSGDRPVMVGDLESADVQRRWPLFAPAASALGAVTVFAFPLLVGVAAVGALEIYWTRRPLGGAALVDGLLFADAALVTLMSGLATGGDWDDSYLDRWPQVHQAAGMVSVQLEIGPAEAYARLRAHAYAGDESLREVARKVVEQELRFSPDMDSS